MSGAEWAAIITAIGIVLGQIATIIMQFKNGATMNEVKKQTDGMATKLADARWVEGKATGKEEKAAEHERDNLMRAEGASRATPPVAAAAVAAAVIPPVTEVKVEVMKVETGTAEISVKEGLVKKDPRE